MHQKRKNMIDMHMHTRYSDGDKTVEEVLRMCEEKGLEYISITDHDTCRQYGDKALQNNKIFSGKIIVGTELHAVFQNTNIEVLGYNVNPNTINKWCEKYYSEDMMKEQQKIEWNRVLAVCDKHGLIYDESKMRKPMSIFEYVSPIIYRELITHKENLEILEEFATSFSTFFRKGLSNPNSSYCINLTEFRPPYKEVIDIIHKAGGKAFLAHPFEYEFNDTIGFIDALRKELELDGIECFHPSSEDGNKRDLLIEYARKNNLFISGGSDFHGSPKPNIKVGVGKGSLNIPKEIIKEWINL